MPLTSAESAVTPTPEPDCSGGRHRGLDDRELFGKICGPAYFDEVGDHGLGHLVRILDGGPVGEHRDVELIDVAPHGDVEAAAGGQRPHRIDLGDQGAAHPAALPGTGNVRDVQVEDLVLPVAA